MNKHTPGKWEAYGTTVHAGKSMVANCEPYYTTKSGDTCLANAFLCASAPDLLAALEAVCSRIDVWIAEQQLSPEETHRVTSVARSAIRKAKGE